MVVRVHVWVNERMYQRLQGNVAGELSKRLEVGQKAEDVVGARSIYNACASLVRHKKGNLVD